MTNHVRVLYHVFDMLRHVYLDRDKLMEYRDKRLRKMVKHAYDCVPFYHERLKQLGLKPSDIEAVNDLGKLPIVRKDEIRKNLNTMTASGRDPRSLVKYWTSGSTGQPLSFYVSKGEDDFRKAKHLRGNITCGQKPRDRWVAVVPPFRSTKITRFQRILGVYAPIPVSAMDDPATQISAIERANPDVLDGYSSSLFLLAKEVEKRGLKTIKPRFLFSGAELTDSLSREYIEKVFDAPFYDRYATIELERMAWQCPAKREYHIDADTVILEFVDRDGEKVAPGERGEIVCTSLFNFAMPFIRYAIGDVGIPSDEECSCNRTFPLMKMVEGRRDSLIVLPDGRVLSPRTLTIAMRMFERYRDIDRFRFVQKKLDLFEVYIQKKEDVINEKTMETELVSHLKKMLNLDAFEMTFKIRFVRDIPLDKSGKLMTVVSELNTKPYFK